MSVARKEERKDMMLIDSDNDHWGLFNIIIIQYCARGLNVWVSLSSVCDKKKEEKLLSYVSAKLMRRRPPRRNYHSLRVYRMLRTVVDRRRSDIYLDNLDNLFLRFLVAIYKFDRFFLLVLAQLTHLRINFGVCLTSKFNFLYVRRPARVYACDGYTFNVSQNANYFDFTLFIIVFQLSHIWVVQKANRTSAIGHLTTFT